VNRDGLVFAARRLDDTEGTWQMPQGGIDHCENPLDAARRELYEETGIRDSLTYLTAIDPWLDYEFPTKVRSACGGGWVKHKGQTQKWVLYYYSGDDSQVDLEANGEREFSEWCWMPITDLPSNVVSFKRKVYERVAQEFAPVIQRLPAVLAAQETLRQLQQERAARLRRPKSCAAV
jgi:putative (di)nucleoside polyphosphate hydrolase